MEADTDFKALYGLLSEEIKGKVTTVVGGEQLQVTRAHRCGGQQRARRWQRAGRVVACRAAFRRAAFRRRSSASRGHRPAGPQGHGQAPRRPLRTALSRRATRA